MALVTLNIAEALVLFPFEWASWRIKMDVGGAYGAGKAGAPFDPLLFVKRPQVIVKGVCLVSQMTLFSFHVK